MSALPPKGDIAECDRHVRFVPKADIQELAHLRTSNFRKVLLLARRRIRQQGHGVHLKPWREISEPLRRLVHRKCLNTLVEVGEHHNADRH